MGLLEKVKEKTTTEVGMQLVYADGETVATVPASGDVDRQSSKSFVSGVWGEEIEWVKFRTDSKQ